MFLRLHRRMVLDYMALYGREAAMAEWNIGPNALDRLIASEKEENPAYEVADKAMVRVELIDAKVRALGQSVSQLQKVIEDLPDTLSKEIGRQLFRPAINEAMPRLPKSVDISIRVPGSECDKHG